MSAERYYTKIKPTFPAENGTPRYSMCTQSYPEEVWKTEEQLRNELTKEGRIYQPIKWAGRIGYAVGIIYALAGATGHALPGFTNQTEGAQMVSGTVTWILSQGILETFGNTLSSWKSKKDTFDKTFPDKKIHLIPERFHPSNLFSRFHSRNH